jgi:RND family efflux transporter MFP subunit
MKQERKVLLAALAAILVLNGCSADRPVIAKTPETVSGLALIQVQEQTVPDTFQVAGTVHASRSAQLSAEVMGRITAMNVREGDAVRAGETLVVMDDVQPKAGYEQAQAALTAAEHELTAAESEHTLAQATFTRMKGLYEKKSISPHEFDEINARMQSTAARHDAAVAVRAQAAAGLEQSRILLERTRVRAPFDGLVTERKVDPGALASPGLPLLTVESTGRYRLEANVNERDLKYVRMNATVPVSLDAFDGAPLSGKVIQIVPAADPASRSFVVKVELPSNPNLRSGLYGHTEFLRGKKQVVMVPHSAVLQRGQIQNVFVVADDRMISLRYVTVGTERAEGMEVLSGLGPGDRVVSNPSGRELAGKKVEGQK